MEKTIWNAFGIAVLLMLGPARPMRVAGAQTEETVPRITARLYNYAEVPRKTIEQAKDIAVEIFEDIAVELTWLDYFSADGNADPHPSCGQPPTPTAINFRPAEQSANPDIFECGLAIPATRGGFSKHAIVFHECVRTLAVGEGSTRVAVLGHIIAHELGHLLLGLGSHSREGIMRYPWSRWEIESAEKGWLRFTPQQGERIRDAVRARNRAGEAVSKD